MTKKKLVALTGSGISAESGIPTFRGPGGLWEKYDVMEMASVEGWNKNPDLLQRFYNDRRKQLGEVEPNDAHLFLAELEKDFDVTVITQNGDDLHERAGSTKILHIHGELTKARSSDDPNSIIDIGYRAIEPGEKASDGSLLRPNVVWFGEKIPAIDSAKKAMSEAEIAVIIGTSLTVNPAADLIKYARKNIPVFLIDIREINNIERDVTMIQQKATSGVVVLKDKLAQILILSKDETKQMTLSFQGANEVEIKIAGEGSMTIDWGDGTPYRTFMVSSSDPASSANYSHIYPSLTKYVVTIFGDNITSVSCNNAHLCSLDVSRNSALKSLVCINSQVTDINVSCNNELINLICTNNKLTSLELSSSLVISRLDCRRNHLTNNALDDLFEKLPPPTGIFRKIKIKDNPGTDTCDKSIAENKGWCIC